MTIVIDTATSHQFSLYCKTFSRDLAAFTQLVDSVVRHNVDGIPFIVSVPAHERSLYSRKYGGSITSLIADEDVLGDYSIGALSTLKGWMAQQVVKLEYGRTMATPYCLVLDSDFYFLRDFRQSDFRDRDGNVMFVATQMAHGFAPQNERYLKWLRGEETATPIRPRRLEGDAPRIPRLWRMLNRLGLDRRRAMTKLSRIERLFGGDVPSANFMPGPIFHSAICRAFHEQFIKPQELSYVELIQYAPWEAVWLGNYALRFSQEIKTCCEPFFLHFGSLSEVERARQHGIRHQDIARRYLGVAMAATHYEQLSFEEVLP